MCKVPGRMGMIVTLYLIMINSYNSVEAPSERGLSFIDIWFVACQISLAFAIIQYGFILGMQRKLIDSHYKDWFRWADVISVVISATYFTISNLVYWTAYFVHSN